MYHIWKSNEMYQNFRFHTTQKRGFTLLVPIMRFCSCTLWELLSAEEAINGLLDATALRNLNVSMSQHSNYHLTNFMSNDTHTLKRPTPNKYFELKNSWGTGAPLNLNYLLGTSLRMFNSSDSWVCSKVAPVIGSAIGIGRHWVSVTLSVIGFFLRPLPIMSPRARDVCE